MGGGCSLPISIDRVELPRSFDVACMLEGLVSRALNHLDLHGISV